MKGGELFGKVDRAKMDRGPCRRPPSGSRSRPDQHRQARRAPASASAAASRTRLPSGWAPIIAAVAPFYGGASDGGRRPQDQGRRARASRRRRHAARAMAWPDYDNAADRRRRAARRAHLRGAVHGFNNDATPERYNKTRGRRRVQADDRVVQQIREDRFELNTKYQTPNPNPQAQIPIGIWGLEGFGVPSLQSSCSPPTQRDPTCP